MAAAKPSERVVEKADPSQLEGLRRLHEGHRTCLKLVSQGISSSKEVSKITGLSPTTVDTYLKQAMKALGANTRREAARIFAAANTSQSLGSPSADLPPPRPSMPPTPPVDGKRIWMRLPLIGGRENDLGWAAKTQHILQIAVISAAVVLGLTLIVAGFYRILR